MLHWVWTLTVNGGDFAEGTAEYEVAFILNAQSVVVLLPAAFLLFAIGFIGLR